METTYVIGAGIIFIALIAAFELLAPKYMWRARTKPDVKKREYGLQWKDEDVK